jgi:hypothetical protein
MYNLTSWCCVQSCEQLLHAEQRITMNMCAHFNVALRLGVAAPHLCAEYQQTATSRNVCLCTCATRWCA